MYKAISMVTIAIVSFPSSSHILIQFAAALVTITSGIMDFLCMVAGRKCSCSHSITQCWTFTVVVETIWAEING